MTNYEICKEPQCLDDIDDCRRDTYAVCTLPKGHDGDHRMTYEDDYKRIVITFSSKEWSDVD